MGANHSIHVANASGQDIYVMAALNPDWAVVDSIADIGVKLLLGVAAGNLHSAVVATQLLPPGGSSAPKNIKSLKDIFACLETARQLLGQARVNAGKNMVDSFKRSAIHIPDGQFKNVCSREVLGKQMTVDGIAALLAKTKNIALVVMSADGRQVAMWNTNSDHSWIATGSGEIRRSKYGTIWQVNDKGKVVRWGA